MEKVYIHGEIIYKDGWFVYIRSNGEVCALTRADAHMVENSGRAYDLYDRGMTGMARSVEGVRTFEEFGISNSHPTIPEYKVDALAPASSDVIIGDVLTIPEKVGEYTINAILENSFQKLQISKIILPATIEKVSRGAFDRCESLKQVIFDGCTPDVSNAFTGCNNLQYDNGFLRFGNTIVKTSEHLAGNVIIPEGVDTILPEAFAHNEGIITISLPESIRNVGKRAFYACKSLTRITFPDSVPEITLGYDTFCSCGRLTDVSLPEGLTDIPEGAFALCGSLSDLKIPSTVRGISEGAFKHSKYDIDFADSSDDCLYVDNWLIKIKAKPIDEIIVKKGTVGIATWAPGHPRHRDNEISTVKLPASVKYLNYGSLYDTARVSIDLNSVEHIEHLSLGAVRVATIHIPASCRYFGIENFSWNSWKDVYFHNPETVMDTSVRSSGSFAPLRVHGYVGSTAERLCKELGEKYSLSFVPIEG